MPRKNINDIKISSYDDLFKSEEQRQEEKLEKIVKLPLEEIHDFKNHPFKVRMDEDMLKLIDSVRDNGVLMPVMVRPDKNTNGYEMISGHRRKFALNQNGITEVDAIIRDLDDDQATIIMVDSNIQREHILPSERGFAYKMKLDAMNRQGQRSDLTCSQLGNKYKGMKSLAIIADEVGESKNQIHRYIRLTYLIEPLRDMVDDIREDGIVMALNPAYELSFLKENEQEILVGLIEDMLSTPSVAQAQEMKRRSQANILDKEFMEGILSMDKPNQKEKISFKMDEVDKYFPSSYTPRQKKETILKLLGNWAKRKEKEQGR